MPAPILDDEALQERIKEAQTDPQALAALYVEVIGGLDHVMGQISSLLTGRSSVWMPEQIQQYRLAQVEREAEAEATNLRTLLAGALSYMSDEGVTHIPVIAPISGAAIADGFSLIEADNERVGAMFMNAKDYVDIRKFGRDIVDIECSAAYLRKGIQGILWGARIMLDPQVPVGSVLIVGETGGRFLTILDVDRSK